MAGNPFLNNQFMGGGITPPQFGNGQLQAPQGASNLPSFNPFAGAAVPSGSPQGMGGGGGNFLSNNADAIGGGLTGVGNFLSGMASNQLASNQQGLYGGNAMMQGINQQEQMAKQGSQAALPYAQPSNTIQPYAKLALASALMQSTPNKLNLPGYMQGVTPQVQDNTNWKGISQAAQQYLSPAALQNAFEVQNKQLLNVDPNAQAMRYSSLFPNDPNAEKDQQDMTNWALGSQQRQAGYENSSRQALQQAIKNAQDNQPGFWSKLGGALLSGASGALTGFGG